MQGDSRFIQYAKLGLQKLKMYFVPVFNITITFDPI